MGRTLRLAVTLLALAPALGARAQVDSEFLPASQVEELDREGEYLNSQPPIGKPPLDCPDILERIPRAQLASLEKNAPRYLIMPNGDAIDAFRALALREIEDRMRTVNPSTKERLLREYDELAPQGLITVRYPNGTVSYSQRDAENAQEGDVVFSFSGVPPLFELPLRPQPETTATFVLLGSRLNSPEHMTFEIIQQTDHWLIGYVERDGARISQRLAVHRRGARFDGGGLERSCVLWPLSRTAESRREYWDRAPLPLFVPLYFEDVRATAVELACAADKGRATLRNHTATTDRTRTVTRTTLPPDIDGEVERIRTNGPWVQKISWRSSPVSVRIVPHDEYIKRRDEQLADPGPPDDAPEPEVTHVLRLNDGRIFRGRLTSEPELEPVTFVVVVGRLEQTMRFERKEILGLDEVE